MNDASVLVCSCTPFSGEVHKKVIDLGPRDNRGVILSVSIKCIRELSEGTTTCLEEGQTLPTGEAGGIGNNQQSGFKGVYQQINNFRSRNHLIKT